MNFSQAIASGFSNYVNFATRAARSEFWFWALFSFIVGSVATFLDFAVFMDFDWETLLDASLSPFNTVVDLALFLPSLAVSVRRLHDIDRTGWWMLLIFTIIGIVLLIVWFCTKGTDGPNRFGPDPLAT
jgi:uncharacterized membrane protein YhaH (DUF805 family)